MEGGITPPPLWKFGGLLREDFNLKNLKKKLKNFNHEDRILIYANLPYFISSSFHEELQNNDRFIIFLKKQIFSVSALRVCDI